MVKNYEFLELISSNSSNCKAKELKGARKNKKHFQNLLQKANEQVVLKTVLINNFSCQCLKTY